MAIFAVVYTWADIEPATASWATQGFYLAVGFYGLQRFVWEFFKPYGPLVGPFTLFHFLSARGSHFIAVAMIATATEATRQSQR